MPALQYPLVNGHRYDFTSVEFDFDGYKPIVKSISYKHTLDPGIVRGNKAQVIGTTRGKYDAEGSIEMYRLEWDGLTTELMKQGVGFLEARFNITVAYSERNSAVMVDRLVGVRLKSPDHNPTEGNDALVVKCDMHIM